MPLCPTCRKEHPSPSGNNIFISVNIPCAISLENIPSEQCWNLPCGHTFGKESLRKMGFTEKKEIIENDTLPEWAKCPITGKTHNFDLDMDTSDFAYDIESYKCRKCSIICNKYSEIYRNTKKVLDGCEPQLMIAPGGDMLHRLDSSRSEWEAAIARSR